MWVTPGRRLEHHLAKRRGYSFGCFLRFAVGGEVVVPGAAMVCEKAR